MGPSPLLDRLAVCSWSLQPTHAHHLADQLLLIEVPRVQIALDPLRDDPPAWTDLESRFRKDNVSIVSGMFGTVGEDYTTLESIRRTGGLVPDPTWEQNWENIRATADLASRLKLNLVTFHAGFLPRDPAGIEGRKLLDRVARVADLFADRNIDLALETGQEDAETLRRFLDQLNRPNVGVNFDPANMILYDKGDPIPALRTLAPFLKQCHVKDARRTRKPGAWGEEVVVGTGEVAWGEFCACLNEIQFEGSCCIEREAGDERGQDILAARKYLETIL